MRFVLISRHSTTHLQLLQVIYHLFAKRLRLSNPWNYKAPVLISATYLVMLALHFRIGEALAGFAWSLCTIVGIAGFGYLSNDLGDRKADQKAGKPNLVATLSKMEIAGLLILFLATAILPWLLYFPLNALTGTLLAIEFLLFLAYVLPPIRLKERGIWGVFTDALYAHVNPAILATITFVTLDGRPLTKMLWPMIGLGIWQFCLGMRNILLHQLKDIANDQVSGLKTWVVTMGEERSQNLLKSLFLPLEICAWVAFLAILTPLTSFPLIGWCLYLIWMLPRQKQYLDTRAWLYRYFDDYYIPWFPLTILAHLAVLDARFLWIALLHILLFKTGFSPLKDRIFRSLSRKP